MGGYRQWQLPKIFNNPQSKNNGPQKDRFSKIINNWQKALNEKKNTIVMMDTNIDTLNTGHNKSFNVENLQTTLFNFLNTNNVTILNKKITHFSKVHQDSCIDHFFSNCSQFMTPVITERLHSDHAITHCTYTSKSQITHPKFAFIRQYHLLTTDRFKSHINNCEKLNEIFSITDPNLIANEIVLSLNSIIDIIAPLKKVHFKKDYVKYHDENIRNGLKQQKILLQQAINSNLVQ